MCYISLLMSGCVACVFLNEMFWHIPAITPLSVVAAFVLCMVGTIYEDNQRDKIKELEKEISSIKKKLKG